MSTKLPESWGSDSQVRGLRIELSAEYSLVLPFDQFAFSELTHEGNEHRLRLVFATHEVLLRGCYLKRVEMTMQKQELSFVAKVSRNYQTLVENHPVIWEISVKEIKPAQGQPSATENHTE
jgi:hypothetical protein